MGLIIDRCKKIKPLILLAPSASRLKQVANGLFLTRGCFSVWDGFQLGEDSNCGLNFPLNHRSHRPSATPPPPIAPCLGACDPTDTHRPPTLSSAMPRPSFRSLQPPAPSLATPPSARGPYREVSPPPNICPLRVHQAAPPNQITLTSIAVSTPKHVIPARIHCPVLFLWGTVIFSSLQIKETTPTNAPHKIF